MRTTFAYIALVFLNIQNIIAGKIASYWQTGLVVFYVFILRLFTIMYLFFCRARNVSLLIKSKNQWVSIIFDRCMPTTMFCDCNNGPRTETCLTTDTHRKYEKYRPYLLGQDSRIMSVMVYLWVSNTRAVITSARIVQKQLGGLFKWASGSTPLLSPLHQQFEHWLSLTWIINGLPIK